MSESLPSVVRSRVNRIAHAVAQQQEKELRDRLLADLRQCAATGATLLDLQRRLDEIEGARK